MLGRGALKAPWIADCYKRGIKPTEEMTMEYIQTFFAHYIHQLLSQGISERGLLRQIKSVSRYMFEDFKTGDEMRRKILLSQTKNDLDRALEFKINVEPGRLFHETCELGLSVV